MVEIECARRKVGYRNSEFRAPLETREERFGMCGRISLPGELLMHSLVLKISKNNHIFP